MSARSVSPSLRHLPASLPVEEGRKNGGQVLHCHFSSGARPGVAPQLTVVMSTTAQPDVARLVKGAHAASVVSSKVAALETTAVLEHSSNDR
jgi:hypothetical protein